MAARPIADFDAYFDRLNSFVLRSGLIMRPVIAAAKADRKRVIYAEGEDERVLRAAQIILEEGLATPILIGRPQVVSSRAERFGLKIRPGRDFELVDPADDPRYRDYVDDYFALVGRRGVTPGNGAHRRAHEHDRDWRARRAPRRGRRAALRPRGPLRPAPQGHPARSSATPTG